MEQPETIICGHCGANATVVSFTETLADGTVKYWPVTSMRGGELFVMLDCPHCGQRAQCVASPGDIPPEMPRHT